LTHTSTSAPADQKVNNADGDDNDRIESSSFRSPDVQKTAHDLKFEHLDKKIKRLNAAFMDYNYVVLSKRENDGVEIRGITGR
jgi:hypothetical protein